MLTLIVGGSASGKSAFAENYAMEAGENRIYIATMQPMDNECLARIEKHRGMRAQKNFQTVECYTGLKQVRVPKDSVVLLECMSNLTANEIYAPEGVGEDRCSEEILARLGGSPFEDAAQNIVFVKGVLVRNRSGSDTLVRDHTFDILSVPVSPPCTDSLADRIRPISLADKPAVAPWCVCVMAAVYAEFTGKPFARL